jgi:hypothetical protein
MLTILTFGLRNEIHNFTEVWTSAMMANILKVVSCLISKTFITINQSIEDCYYQSNLTPAFHLLNSVYFFF